MQQQDEAEDLIDQLTPEYHDELAAAAEDFLKKNDYMQAMGHFMLAIKSDPSVFKTKQRFVEFAHNWFLNSYNPFLEDVIVICLKTENLACSPLHGVWLTLSLHHPLLGRFFGPKAKFDPNILATNKKLEPFLIPFFLQGLRNLHIHRREFEKLLIALRRMLLQDVDTQKNDFRPQDRLALASSIACYCAFTEYVFETDVEEDRKWQKLKAKVESEAAPQADEVAIIACYQLLHELASAKAVGDMFRNDPDLGQVVREQIDLYAKLGEIAKNISSITEIDDPVSRKVQGQYEVFPYPRWRFAFKPHADPRIFDKLMGRPIKVLVAGCGTGHEPTMLAGMLPQAQILAVDLSRSSLSYAIYKANQLGLKNIDFRHGDILKLGCLTDKYDFICSGGVLHHMEDPVKGWKVLVDLMAPDGVMQIGLYSKIARRFILKAQDFVKEKNYPNDAQGMRTFRREAPALLKKEVLDGIMSTADFYNLSMLRDLLFHVQEHDMDVPMLEEYIDEVGLEFIGFNLGKKEANEKYRMMFPKDPEGSKLSNWHVFEQANPDTFDMMYQFWLRKKAA